MTHSASKRTRAPKRTVPARTQASKRRGTFPGKVSVSRAPQLSAISAAVLVTLGASRYSFALPTGEQVTPGQVSIQRPSASSMVINQNVDKASVNWQSFSIGKKESVDVHQPNSGSVLLNRVIGVDASDIQGRLSSNGKVFLLNPNGITFGPTAQVAVGGLVASTLSMSDKDFYAGNYKFTGNGKPGSVEVQPGATITAQDYGYVALLGGEVSNQGLLSAKLGTVALAAGNSVTLDFAGDGLTKIKVDKAALDAVVANHGAIIADGGQAILTVNSSVALAQTVVNQRGVIRAQSLLERNGRIILDSVGEGDVIVSGTVDASAPTAGTTGGTVHVTGDRVGIVDHGSITVSGAAGGGEALIGGGLHGAKPEVRNASATFVGSDTTISADALSSGNGGTVAVWSDGSTRAYGSISARGGTKGGDGGFIETSGKSLDVGGIRVDASAANGHAGTWLLDPLDITISSGGNAQVTDAPNFTPIGGGSNVSVDSITAALNSGANVTVASSSGSELFQNGDIRWLESVPGKPTDVIYTGDRSVSLTLSAFGGIDIGHNVHIVSNNGPLSLNLRANQDNPNGFGAIFVDHDVLITTRGGNVSMGGGSTNTSVDLRGGSANPIVIDTRIPQRDQAGSIDIEASGAIRLTRTELHSGLGNITIRNVGDTGGGVAILGSVLDTTDGNLQITGLNNRPSNTGIGVSLSADFMDGDLGGSFGDSVVQTGRGKLEITGTASITGVDVTGVGIVTGTGDLAITGHASGATAAHIGASNGSSATFTQITTGAPSAQISGEGSIAVDGFTRIVKNGATDTKLQLISNTAISLGPLTKISSNDGALQVQLTVTGDSTTPGISIDQGTAINTRGGELHFQSGTMKLNGVTDLPILIDTRIPDTDRGGPVLMQSPGGTIDLKRTTMQTGAGAITIGSASDASVTTVNILGSVLETTAGDVQITGVGTSVQSGGGGQGVLLSSDFLDKPDLTRFPDSHISTGTGKIDIRGTVIDSSSGTGLELKGFAVNSTAGLVTLTGRAGEFGTGVNLSSSAVDPAAASAITVGGTSATIVGGPEIVFGGGTKITKTGAADTQLSVQADGNISFGRNNNISSNDGRLLVDLDAGRDGRSGGGISIAAGTSFTTRGGNIQMRGTADAQIGGAEFIRLFGELENRITVDTTIPGTNQGGAVTMIANGVNEISTGEFAPSLGRIYLAGVDMTTGSGNIQLTGRGSVDADGLAIGVEIASSTLRTNSGSILIDGIARSATIGAFGVRISNLVFQSPVMSELSTFNGAIRITGTAEDVTAPANSEAPLQGSVGVLIAGQGSSSESAMISSAAGGSITINGSAGRSQGQSIGVDVNGASIAASAGDISLTGIASGADNSREDVHAGLRLLNSSLVTTEGRLLLTGTGRAGAAGIDGVAGGNSEGIGRNGTPGTNGEFGADGILITASNLRATNGVIGILGRGGHGGNGGAGGDGGASTSGEGKVAGGDGARGGNASSGGIGLQISASTLSALNDISIIGQGGQGGTGGAGGRGGAGFNGGIGGAGGNGGDAREGGHGLLMVGTNITTNSSAATVSLTGTGGNGGAGGAGGRGGDGSRFVNINPDIPPEQRPVPDSGGPGGQGGDGASGRSGMQLGDTNITSHGPVTISALGGTGGAGGKGGLGGKGFDRAPDGSVGLGGIGGDAGLGLNVDHVSVSTDSGAIDIRGIGGTAGAGGLEGLERFSSSSGLDADGIVGNGDSGDLTLSSNSGSIVLAGYSPGGGNGTAAGVTLPLLTASTKSGSIDIAGGRAGFCSDCDTPDRGIELGTGSVVSTGGGAIRITGDANSGLAMILIGTQIGGSTQTGNIVLRGGSGNTIQLLGDSTIQTSGAVNFRPGFVNPDPVFGDLAFTPMAYQPDGQAPTSGAFWIDSTVLHAITRIPAAVVFGSDQQFGKITISAPLDLSRVPALSTADLTLQNPAAGSGGIDIQAAITVGGTLALVSGGEVKENAAGRINAANLVLLGVGEGAKFSLANPLDPTVAANKVDVLAAFTDGAHVAFANNGTLALSPLPWKGFTASDDTVTSNTVSTFGATGANQTSAANGMNVPFFVHAVGGELHLGVTTPETDGGSGFATTRASAAVAPEELHIATPNGSIMLVGDTNFVNSRDTTFSTSIGGRFIVATADPDRMVQGNITVNNRTPNIYNCGFAAGCIPDQGNHFVFTREMLAIVDIGNATRVAGEQNPQFTVTQSGLRADLGDTMSDLTSGKPVTTAGVNAAAGRYPINLDSDFSPARYTLLIRPGVLQVEQRPIIPDVYLVPTDTPAGSLAVPQICTAIAPAPIAYSDASAGDAVDREWSRVKQRLVLSTCTGVRMKESCGDF